MQVLAGFVMGAGCRKNHDKQLTHIVRVIVRFLLIVECHDVIEYSSLFYEFFRVMV